MEGCFIQMDGCFRRWRDALEDGWVLYADGGGALEDRWML